MTRRGRISLGERVYRALCRDLAAGAVDPTVRLGEERLAETYGVSRTPVREALARLLADGLVERHDDGLYPYRPRLDELGDLYELRIILEARGIQRVRFVTTPLPEAARSAGSSTAAHDQLAIRRELDRWRRLRDNPPDADAGLIAADEQFHTAVLTAAGNAALADALISVQAKIRPIRSLDMPTPERIATMTADHIAIAEYLLTGDLDRALDTLHGHILRSRTNVLARARKALEFTKLGQALRD
ncbi:GntR family transcriptional regulator [Nocardia wallacei]|uniref:GntR family transcriptional regulator n=1 Tax=Nocardia wallacei TaxID=480035 RepID=UPI0024566D2A|nr:GntR family transcriptional regulator [Nocardia wallacei]